MTRCAEAVKKWRDVIETKGEVCDLKHHERVKYQIGAYIDFVCTMVQRGAPEDAIYCNFPERPFRVVAKEPGVIREPVLEWAIERATNGIKTTTNDVRQKIKELKGSPDLPADKYRVIYCDPPWKYSDELIDGYGGAATIGDRWSDLSEKHHHYETMSIEELSELSISEIALDDAVLFIWVTSPFLEDVFKIINAWDFEYKASFVWDKVKHNFGHYNSVRHELLLICTRGSCTPDHVQPTDESGQLIDSVQTIPRSDEHSEKPEEFRAIIDKLYTKGKRIELFARKSKEEINKNTSLEWDVWGDEISDAEAMQ